METEAIKSGLEQMYWEIVDNGTIKLPSSRPARYEFIEPATYRPDTFEEAVEQHDFTISSTHTELQPPEDGDGFYYYTRVTTDHYKTVKLKIWRETCNVYPIEDPPDTYEFSRLLEAVETAFGELAPVDEDQEEDR
jgi:hypothetical protein